MYEVVAQTPKEVFMTYAIILSSCAITFPLVMVIVRGIDKGRRLSKWR